MTKPFDLEERTFQFAQNVRKIVREIPNSEFVKDDLLQLIRSSGSVGANYREANDGLSKKDFQYRMRIARKELKESKFWLRLLHDHAGVSQPEIQRLIDEAQELKLIMSSIITRTANK